MTKIWRETGFVENDPWVIETDEVKATELTEFLTIVRNQ